ncbi:MAG: gliding motility-associated C-terminal domain-containing protein [Bacteroidaceae bacterium]|nr:gliding motility-associated C-terminal domain-containing protein [Bacteroidaceae bacterium]
MKERLFALLCLLAPAVLSSSANDWLPSVEPVGIFINHDGEEEELSNGTYDAPLEVTFYANPRDTAGYVIYYEWTIVKIEDSEESVLAVRNDEITEYTFRESGTSVKKDGVYMPNTTISYRVGLSITYRNKETGEEGTSEQEEADMMKFSLKGSSIYVYNAFSPNGDGKNDLFRVKTQSLLSFKMAIFNRWGEKIVSGTEKTLEVEYESDYAYYVCWDGTINGQQAPDGVYFISVEAVGSDGVIYTQRSDINLLTTSRERTTNTNN